MTLAQDVHDRLRAALPEAVPVLLPEQMQTPLEAAPKDAQGRPMVGGGERGLGAYLKEHPQGYVQIEDPRPAGTDGLAGALHVTVSAVHTTPAGALALGLQVRAALCGHPFAPRACREVFNATPARIADSAYAYRPTFERTTINGELTGGTPA